MRRWLFFLLAVFLFAHPVQAFGYGWDTHRWISEQSLYIWPNDMNHEVYNFSYWILNGSQEEDDYEWRYNSTLHVFVRYPRPFEHFWNPDGGFEDGLPLAISAVEKATNLWDEAISQYHDGYTHDSYYILGRIAHLLSDMTVPAHVHLDPHFPDDFIERLECEDDSDSYENYMAYSDNYSQWCADNTIEGCNDPLTQLLGYQNLELRYDNSTNDFNGYDYSDLPAIKGWRQDQIHMFNLFLYTAEISDNFESDGDMIGCISAPQLGYPENDYPNEIQNHTYTGEVSPDECQIHGDTLMPLAMRSVAGLYKLFWDVVYARWPMFGHDSRHTNRSPYKGPSLNDLRWTPEGTSPTSSTYNPIIDGDGTLYLVYSGHGFEDDWIRGYNPTTGTQTKSWRFPINDREDRILDCYPAIGPNGLIYVVQSIFRDSGAYTGFRVYSLNPENQSQESIFEAATANHLSTFSITIGGDGTVYIPTDDGSLYALTPSGNLKWVYNKAEEGSNRYNCWSAPAIGKGEMIYIAMNEIALRRRKIVALDPNNGNEVYSLYLDQSSGTGDMYSNDSSPAIAPDGTIYVGGHTNLYSLTPELNLTWSFSIYPYYQNSTPAIGGDGTIYIGKAKDEGSNAFSTLYAINPDGTIKWEKEYPTDFDYPDTFGNPIIDKDGKIYVGIYLNESEDFTIYCFRDWGVFAEEIWTFPHAYSGDLVIGKGSRMLYAVGSAENASQTLAIGHAITTHNLTIQTNSVEFGLTRPVPETYSLEEDTVAEISALPFDGFAFDHWEGDVSGSTNPLTVTVNTDMSVTAVFSAIVTPPTQYTVNTATQGSGTIALDPTDGTYDEGSSVSITAIAGTDYQFDHWEGDVSGSTNPIDITMDNDMNVTAVFTEIDGDTAVFPSSDGLITVTISAGNLDLEEANVTIPENLDFFYPPMNITITNVAVGTTVDIAIDLPTAAPAEGSAYKLINGIWENIDSRCQFNPQRTNVSFQITDSGWGDNDNIDGQISDPFGIARSVPNPSGTTTNGDSGGGGGGGCFIKSMF